MAKIRLGRTGTPEDVTTTALFLACLAGLGSALAGGPVQTPLPGSLTQPHLEYNCLSVLLPNDKYHRRSDSAW